MLIMMYVINELSYESFQINRQNIYRVAVKWGNEGNIMKFAGSMPALAPAINEKIPKSRLLFDSEKTMMPLSKIKTVRK